MTRRGLFLSGPVLFGPALLGLLSVSACMPTIDVKVEPINIYAKLDADVRIRLDKEVQDTIKQNPNLF